jgi:hypothetical protein
VSLKDAGDVPDAVGLGEGPMMGTFHRRLAGGLFSLVLVAFLAAHPLL